MKKIHFTDRYLLNPRHPVVVAAIGRNRNGLVAAQRTGR